MILSGNLAVNGSWCDEQNKKIRGRHAGWTHDTETFEAKRMYVIVSCWSWFAWTVVIRLWKYSCGITIGFSLDRLLLDIPANIGLT